MKIFGWKCIYKLQLLGLMVPRRSIVNKQVGIHSWSGGDGGFVNDNDNACHTDGINYFVQQGCNTKWAKNSTPFYTKSYYFMKWEGEDIQIVLHYWVMADSRCMCRKKETNLCCGYQTNRMLAMVMKTTTAASQLTTLACAVLSCLVCATSAIEQSSLHTDVSTFPGYFSLVNVCLEAKAKL